MNKQVINYEGYGNTEHPVLVLLHGNGEDGSYFHHQIAYFKTSYYVITMDMRGHGKSEAGNVPLCFSLFAQDVIQILDNLKIRNCSVLGFSDGASTAMDLAIHHPERIQALILNGANRNPKGVKRRYQYPIVLGYYMVSLFACMNKKLLVKKQILGLMVNYPDCKPESLQSITIPTLVIVGDKDMIKESHTREIARYLPNSTLKIIKGNHFIAAKQHEVFNQEVASFLHKALT